MLIVLGGVLDAHEASAAREAAGTLPYDDGRATAGRYAREVKRNEQAAASPARDALLEKARRALDGNAAFRAAARPRRFARLLLSRYRPGMEYGAHVDDPIIDGARTDLSFTLFLSDPATYDGGGLVLDDRLEERVIRLAPGDAVLYPTSALHRVEPVTWGERMAIVGWVTSWVRDAARREILFDLDEAARAGFSAHGKTPAFDLLCKAKSNLYRMWADG